MWSTRLFSDKSKFVYLFIATLILLFAFLGSREIWTQEHRWADIVSGMFYRHDFFHPFLGEVTYYDKPLLSYWLIAGFSFVMGEVSTWALRLPSALAGLLAIFSMYRLGTHLKDKQLGLLSGWMLLTTFYFVFWARTSSADMLNLGGSLFAICWYFEKKHQPSFFNYSVFFLIIALTSLCKGLAIVPMLVIFADLLMNQEWKRHLHLRVLLSMIPGMLIYLLPFWLSTHVGGETYAQNGLSLVYRENFLRYFQPFDHKGPIYTYLIFLPVYLLPWALFFIPALFAIRSRWKLMSSNSKWAIWSLLLLFLFFSLSGSRRNYYVLPMLPFAILLTADWILLTVKRARWAGRIAIAFFLLLVLDFNVLQPLYYAESGAEVFSEKLMKIVEQKQAKAPWNIVLLDAESKLRFYLKLSPNTKDFSVHGERDETTDTFLLQLWSAPLSHPQSNVIYVSRKRYESLLKTVLKNYDVIEAPPRFSDRFLKKSDADTAIAFIPHFQKP